MAAWAYPTTLSPGYWGAATSTENFCEEDYNISHYLAEFINTLTSIGYVLYAAHGLNMVRGGKLPSASSLPYLALAGVGVFSAVFHATLWVETQRCDGLSMLVAAATTFYRVMTFQKSREWSARLAWGLIASLLLVSALYVALDILIVHQAAFGIVCTMVAFRTRRLMVERVKDVATRKRLLRLAHFGTACALTGFSIWLLDNFACSRLRAARDVLGLPWGFLLEFHGWWHVLTGVASYVYMTLVEIILSDPKMLHGTKDLALYAWPMSAVLAAGTAPKPYTNGKAKTPTQRKH